MVESIHLQIRKRGNAKMLERATYLICVIGEFIQIVFFALDIVLGLGWFVLAPMFATLMILVGVGICRRAMLSDSRKK